MKNFGRIFLQLVGLSSILTGTTSTLAFSTSRMLERQQQQQRRLLNTSTTTLLMSDNSDALPSTETTTTSSEQSQFPIPLISDLPTTDDDVGTLAPVEASAMAATSSPEAEVEVPQPPVVAAAESSIPPTTTTRIMPYNDFGGMIVVGIDRQEATNYPAGGMEASVGSEVGYFVSKQKANGMHCHSNSNYRK